MICNRKSLVFMDTLEEHRNATGLFKGTAAWKKAMGIDWMTRQ